VTKSIWEDKVRKNTSKKALESCNKLKRKFCTKEGKCYDLSPNLVFKLKR